VWAQLSQNEKNHQERSGAVIRVRPLSDGPGSETQDRNRKRKGNVSEIIPEKIVAAIPLITRVFQAAQALKLLNIGLS
jgi:hypothetical protein